MNAYHLWAGIFRNHAGLPFLAYTSQISTSSPVQSELHALLQGLILANKHSVHDLITKGDCDVIMQSMHESHAYLTTDQVLDH